MHSVEEIVKGCRKFKKKAQKALYDKYAPVMKGICSRYSNSNVEAEEILQEAFLKIFTNISQFNDNGNFEGWMKKIMINTSITYYRKNLKHNIIDSVDCIDEDIIDENNDDLNNNDSFTSVTAKEIMKAVQELPNNCRTIFNLFVMENYSHDEIAETLNISSGYSRSQFSRARKMVQNKLFGVEVNKELSN